MKRALIIGCGYSGTRVAQILLAQGVEVAASTRSGETLPGTTGIALDLSADDPISLPDTADTVVYYMVGTLYRHYDESGLPHLRLYQRLLDTLATRPPKGLIYLSSTSVYGDQDGAWIDEATPIAPRSPWGKMRADLEQASWTFGRHSDCPACVVRLPEIYGPGRSAIDRLKRGYALRVPHRYSNRIHVEDLAQVLAQLGRQLNPELLLVSDGQPAQTDEVYDYAAAAAGLPKPERGGTLPDDPNIRALVSDSKRCRSRVLPHWLAKPLRYPNYRVAIDQEVREAALGRG